MNSQYDTDAASKPMAFFDFDGTLTTGDTLMPFLKFVVGKPVYYIKLLMISPVLVAYFLKLLRNDVAKQWVLKWYLSGYELDTLLALGEEFSCKVIPKLLRQEGMEKLRWHQGQGHECILVSASLDVYLASWSVSAGFDALLSSKLESNSGVVSGNLYGDNCFGEEKVVRIKEWLAGRKPEETFAYGDSNGDMPMLSLATVSMYLIKKRSKSYWRKI